MNVCQEWLRKSVVETKDLKKYHVKILFPNCQNPRKSSKLAKYTVPKGQNPVGQTFEFDLETSGISYSYLNTTKSAWLN